MFYTGFNQLKMALFYVLLQLKLNFCKNCNTYFNKLFIQPIFKTKILKYITKIKINNFKKFKKLDEYSKVSK